MKRECVVISYTKDGSRWKETSREERGAIVCDLKHWRAWAEFDRNLGGSARCETIALNDSTMYRYTTTSPDRKTKLVYQFHGVVYSN